MVNSEDYEYDSNVFCKTENNFYNLFYKCVDPSHNYYLQYSGFYNSQLIEFNLPNPLSSYIMEFWFYPDFFLRAKARESQFNYPTYTKNFFFHSNVIDCYFSQTDRLVPYIYDSYKVIKINKLFNSNEWNNFVIFGKYAFDQPFEFDISKQNKATILTTITFCENKCQDINGDNIHWTTGYYRDLKIWDGNMASFSQIIQYEHFYPLSKYSKRVKSILHYFPFSNQYIANNKIRDPQKNYIFNINSNTEFRLKKYNYGENFDIIVDKAEEGYYSSHASDPAYIDSCDIGCKRCWDKSFCYECITNYFLSGRKCLLISKYYFRNPPHESNSDFELNYNLAAPGITITFWTKPIGFEFEQQVMITLGSNPNLLLMYSGKEGDDPGYGLFLLGNKDSYSEKRETIGFEREFRDNIGKWTFISIAFHKQIKNDDELYFPRMIKFEINTNSIEANPQSITENPNLNKITLHRGYYGLFVGIKYYKEYIIQAIAFEIKVTTVNPFPVPELKKAKYESNDLALKCENVNGKYTNSNSKIFSCVPDESPDIGSFLDTCPLYKDTLTTKDSCLNYCSGSGWTRCNCKALNHNSQMIYKNNNKNLCRPLDYINFSKIRKIEVENLGTAKVEKKCTMQFWMYAYPYESNKFKGITFQWTGHNKIKLTLISNDKYRFTCFANTGDENDSDIAYEEEEGIEMKQWVFLSCAVDYGGNQKLYLNSNSEKNKILYKEKWPVSGVIGFTGSKLIITDDTDANTKDWGLLFFRQIRLWKDAYFNAGFLSRILIETPAKFPTLMSSWEPTFNGIIGDSYENRNLVVKDLVNNIPLNVKYQTDYQSEYGMNVIDENYYSILTMCSEDGLYYDVTLQKCLQFLDLSKMKDFTFKELPSAYSGSYAMAFWIFFEDCDKYISRGLHIKWSRHLQIIIKKDNTENKLYGYCFPQGYYSDYEINEDDSNINEIYENTLNKAKIILIKDNSSENGVWIWVICSVSYYSRYFFLQGNRDDIVSDIIHRETLRGEGDDKVYTYYPMRFYLSDLNNKVMYKSSLSIININEDKKIYLREILLFRNFIPKWYSDKFKYMNMKMLTDNQLPALLFVVNFADFNLETKNLKYIYFERKVGSTIYERVDTSLYLTVKSAGSTFELSANFEFQPLCDLSTTEFKKYENGRCVDIDDCKLQDISATYCMGEQTPLTCETGNLLTLNSVGGVECKSQCYNVENVEHIVGDNNGQTKFNFIIPGTTRNRGICNTLCPDETLPETGEQLCPYTLNLMKCDPKDQIGYKCIEKEKNDISALFFSKCYNSPNFYRTISTTTLSKISSGYFYEFWMKIDTELSKEFTCKEAGTANKEYYLYSTPHSIYFDREEGKYFYQIINSAYKSKMDGIVDDNWNKIVIETSITTTGQDVRVHTNFEKGESIITISSVSLSIPMRLQYISFCSRKASGDCIPGSSNIMWGSAYYRNIRVWDIRSSSIYTIQDYNNGIFTDQPTSLILNYPLTIEYIDKNIIKETISGTDSINVTHQFSNNFQSEDNVINYNYETNLLWDLKHQCLQKEEDLVEVSDKLILVKEDCINITGYYLKVPASSSIGFNITEIDLLAYESYTFCIYMKFIGVLSDSTSAQPIIFSFKDDTFIVYDIATSYLIFYIGGSDKEAFRDTNFHAYIGVWTPICIANLRSKDTYIHPHMITLNVNKIDIPFSSGFSIAKDGIHIERIALGTEIIAYFADFRIYNRFIQGNFGTIISKTYRDEEDVLLLHYPLTCDENNKVIADFSDSSMDPPCVEDHNIYLNATWTDEKNDEEYFDTELIKSDYKAPCSDYCKTLCYNSKNSECTCDMTETVYWLRRNKATSKTYCEHPPYIDYSILKDIDIRVPSSSTNESTIEFWFYIYSYNTTNINFKEINIIWDKHNRVQIINERNSLSAKCFALWDTSDETIYTEQVQTISVTAFGWTSIRCGSDINLPTYKHFFNTYEKTVSFGTLPIPYNRNESPTKLIIRDINTSPPSYGFFFIRELKLWQQYNVNYIDTSYINLDLVYIGFYNPLTKITEGKYPGLITLIRSEYSIDDFSDSISGHYHTENLVINEEDPGDYDRIIELEKDEDNFIGYNIIDPTNSDYYKTLVLCDEGWVYNSLFNYCEKPSYTKCLYPGDVKDNCIRCPDEQIYIHPVDGLCKEDCPTGYYHRDDMNQCRPCNETCYKCNWTFGFNCTECIGDRYLVEHEGQCVQKCEDFNLTASKIRENYCTEFYADAVLLNHKAPPDEYVDVNTFVNLVGKVTEYTSRDYTVLWGFERELTIEANAKANKTIELPNRSPLIGDLTKEENVLLDKTFFELAKYYVFSLTVIAHNILYYEATVSQKINFTLLMNSYPVNGSLTVFPETGLYRTTYFVIRCVEFGDETTVKENLEYSFYSIEENTAVVNHLRGWSKENEISTNFSVIYYQQEKSVINIYCRIKDELNATYTTEAAQITIAKSLNGGCIIFLLHCHIMNYQLKKKKIKKNMMYYYIIEVNIY